MYKAFYGLTDKPFSMLPDPHFLYLGKKHQTALTMLQYGLMNQASFCVISGEIGAGKTTLIRALFNDLSDNFTVGLITNTHQSFGELLDWVLSAFEIEKPDGDKVDKYQAFVNFVLDQYAKNRNALLVVDEAQNMSIDMLEELRMLSNVNSEKDQVLQIILAGQPALKDTLRQPELMQFAQRIGVEYHLNVLGLDETGEYIRHRLSIAGCESRIFSDDAIECIYAHSGGTPRLINLLCDTALVYGFAEQVHHIDVNLVEEVVWERLKNSVVPLVGNVKSMKRKMYRRKVAERKAERKEMERKAMEREAARLEANRIHNLNTSAQPNIEYARPSSEDKQQSYRRGGRRIHKRTTPSQLTDSEPVSVKTRQTDKYVNRTTSKK